MREKALILAAQPPFEGPWVSLRNGARCIVQLQSRPNGIDLEKAVTLEVMDLNGDRCTVHPSKSFEGVAARAIVEELEGLEVISVLMEEVS